MSKYRKAHIGQDPFIIVQDFPGDDPLNGDIMWVKIKRPTGHTIAQITEIRGISKINEKTGVPELAMNPVEAMLAMLPDSIISWSLVNVETNEPIAPTMEEIYDLDAPDFQHLMNAWTALLSTVKQKPVKLNDPKTEITTEEKKESASTLANVSDPSEVGPTLKSQLHLVVPSANG